MRIYRNSGRTAVLIYIILRIAVICLISALFQSAYTKDSVSSVKTVERSPNIILMIGDDHGFPYYGFMGADYVLTPNLDLMARDGVVFPFAHSTCSYCQPSLITLLTGLYPLQYEYRLKHELSSKVQERPGMAAISDKAKKKWAYSIQLFETLPRLLAQHGYACFEGGKLWEGPYELAGFTHGMSEDWKPEYIKEYGLLQALAGGPGLALGRTTMDPMYDFIRSNKERPFFVWYAPMLPHVPFNAPYTYQKYYKNVPISESAKLYYANCTWFDDGVGKVLDFLEAEGLCEKTLIVYVNDNGWEQPPDVDYTGNPDASALGGTRGKNSLHDFGFRTPLIFYWPGHTPGGKEVSGMYNTVDLVPTLLDYAGIKAPEGLPGRSLRSAIEGNKDVSRDVLIGCVGHIRDKDPWKPHQQTGYYLRTPKWHYIVCDPIGMEELYDMEQDPNAQCNVIEEHRDLAQQFRKQIEAWRIQILGENIKEPLTDEW